MFEKYFENAKILQKSSQIVIIKGKSQISHRCLLQENTVPSFIWKWILWTPIVQKGNYTKSKCPVGEWEEFKTEQM